MCLVFKEFAFLEIERLNPYSECVKATSMYNESTKVLCKKRTIWDMKIR